MNTYEVLRRLRQRHKQWTMERFRSNSPGRPDFLNGVLRGLTEAVEVARSCHEEQSSSHIPRKKGLKSNLNRKIHRRHTPHAQQCFQNNGDPK